MMVQSIFRLIFNEEVAKIRVILNRGVKENFKMTKIEIQ